MTTRSTSSAVIVVTKMAENVGAITAAGDAGDPECEGGFQFTVSVGGAVGDPVARGRSVG